jgi:hypothetical protein
MFLVLGDRGSIIDNGTSSLALYPAGSSHGDKAAEA